MVRLFTLRCDKDFYIKKENIKKEEWELLKQLPKHTWWGAGGASYIYIHSTVSGELIDRAYTYRVRYACKTFDEFIKMFNEYRLMRLI